MKKNKFLKLASGLLVLCLLTTCVISTTFAKYTTSGDANDTARVAKWGVQITQVVESSGKAFAAEYDKQASGYAGITKSVDSADDADVVAPGTSGILVQFQVTGTPEVAVDLDFVVTTADGTGNTATDVYLGAGDYKDWTTALTTDTFTATEYHPIKFTIKKDGSAVTGYEGVTLAKVEEYIEGLSKEVAPNTDLATGAYVVEWTWDYDVDAAADKADTLLGNIAADKATYGKKADDSDADYSLTISFALTITATQID